MHGAADPDDFSFWRDVDRGVFGVTILQPLRPVVRMRQVEVRPARLLGTLARLRELRNKNHGVAVFFPDFLVPL